MFLVAACGSNLAGSPDATVAPSSVRLYVLDGGTLQVADVGRFGLKREEVATVDFSVAAFLVVHPKGTLMWDTGAVPDAAWTATAAPSHHLVLPDSQQRDLTLVKPLNAQLAEAGYAPGDITYLALSHYHYDHTANANDFAGATWLVRQVERDAMFSENPGGTAHPATYAALRNSKVQIVDGDEENSMCSATVP